MHNFYDKTKGIVQYIHSKNRNRIGVMVAFYHPNIPNKIVCGWSLCAKADKYDNDRAIETAYVRAIRWNDKPKVKGQFWSDREHEAYFVADSIKGEFFAFVKRACRYFKRCELTEWVSDYYEYEFKVNEDKKPSCKDMKSIIKEVFDTIEQKENVPIYWHKYINNSKIKHLQIP